MSGTDLRVYSFGKVSAAINGAPISGLWEGEDVIQIEPNSDKTAEVVGADGEVLISGSTDQSAIITLKIQPTSDTNAVLTGIWKQMQGGNVQVFSFACVDTSTGEGGSAAECVLKAAPSQGFGQQASVREFKLFAGCWVPNTAVYTGP